MREAICTNGKGVPASKSVFRMSLFTALQKRQDDECKRARILFRRGLFELVLVCFPTASPGSTANRFVLCVTSPTALTRYEIYLEA